MKNNYFFSIIHFFFSSDNIFLNFGRSGGHYTAVIGDFDTAKWVDSGVGQTRTIVGTTNYLAPEIVIFYFIFFHKAFFYFFFFFSVFFFFFLNSFLFLINRYN